MGRKGSLFSSLKKAISPDSKKKKAKKPDKSKKKWFGKEKPSYYDSPNQETIEVSNLHPLPPLEDIKLTEVEDDQTEHDHSIAADAAANEPPIAAPEVAVEVVHQSTKVTQFTGKSEEEVAAIKIQTAFRGYLARRALRDIKGLVRLKLFVDGPTVKRQTANTLKCIQTLSRVHAQIQSRRLRMAEENRTLRKQLLQKHAKELESLRVGEEWDQSLQSKEQIEASLLQKFEASMRRERALAYSYTHQQTWKKSAVRPTNLLFMDPMNPHWGWSWLERSTRRWESQAKDINSSIKSGAGGEITKSYARHQINSETQPSPDHQKLATPFSPRGSPVSQDDDSRSTFCIASEQNRRHTIGGGSSVKDDESLASSPSSVPSYMAPTRSTKGKLKLPSPLGAENGLMKSDKGSGGPRPVKKRLSYPPSPAKPRRHSGSPKVETSAVVENGVLVS